MISISQSQLALRCWLACLLLMFVPVAMAQDRMTDAEQRGVVAGVVELLRGDYIYPDRADDIGAALSQWLQESENGPSSDEFARSLSQKLVEETGDLHFAVQIDPDWIASINTKGEDKAATSRADHGFRDARILRGNIGYIRFDYFADPDVAGDTLAAAMKFTETSDALIFDLRYNNGGHLEMAQMVMSYLFGSEDPVPLFQYFYNEDGTRTERGQWVLPHVPGKRRPDVPVYVLTSNTSFSSAEWFTTVLKSYGRATVVGGVTAGGAHPVTRKPIDETFVLQLPFGQIFDPVTGEDFEGTGVEPDIKVPSVEALRAAHLKALDDLHPAGSSHHSKALWLRPLIERDYNDEWIGVDLLKRVVGSYEGREIVRNGSRLEYVWRERYRLALHPLSDTEFAVEGVDMFRFRLVDEGPSRQGLERIDQDGTRTFYRRLDESEG